MVICAKQSLNSKYLPIVILFAERSCLFVVIFISNMVFLFHLHPKQLMNNIIYFSFSKMPWNASNFYPPYLVTRSFSLETGDDIFNIFLVLLKQFVS